VAAADLIRSEIAFKVFNIELMRITDRARGKNKRHRHYHHNHITPVIYIYMHMRGWKTDEQIELPAASEEAAI